MKRDSSVDRRGFLKTAAAIGGAAALASARAAEPTPQVDPEFRVRNKRIRQSIMGWTFNPMPTPELARHCRDIGLVAMEGISSEHYPMVKELGLEISLVGSHGFSRGPFNPANHEFVITKLREGIDLAVATGCPSVITFTGMREAGISDEQGAKNCVDAW